MMDTLIPTRCSSPSCYLPLDPDHIRVLELEPGPPSAPIVGRLVHQAIDGEPYEAISYVWGDALQRRDVVINGVSLSVTLNLHGALTAFRHAPPVGTTRRLWADALCINQEDLAERTSQVELMGRIFAGGSRVLAWLGWEEGEQGRQHTLAAIRFIHEFMEDPEAGLRDSRILLRHDPSAASLPGSTLSDEEQGQFEVQAWKWKCIKMFFEIEYFHRAWIVQELGLAREAIMCAAVKPRADDADGIVALDFLDWPLIGRFVTIIDYSAASLVTHLGLLCWITHHTVMVWEVKADGTPACDFLTSMHWTRVLNVTDPRDRVYSLLGHPYAMVDGRLIIKPDYTITRGVLYTRLAASFIRRTRNLDAVSLVDHEEDPFLQERVWDPTEEGRMPSWVPDWQSINRTTPLDYPIAAAVVEDDWIRVEGDILGTVGRPLPHLLVRGWVVDEVVAVSHRMETTDFPVTHLAREQAKEHPFWLDKAWKVAFPVGEAPGHNALVALETLSLALSFGVKEVDDGVSKAGLNQTLEEHHRSFAAYVMKYHKLWKDSFEAGGGEEYLPSCSLFDSLPVQVQRTLRWRAEGASSGGFLECMTWPAMCRVVYRTSSGFVGVGSRVTRPGDIVCRLRGSSALMTLRRIENPEPDKSVRVESKEKESLVPCAFVGPTVVPARVKRGVVDGKEFGEEAVTFRIV